MSSVREAQEGAAGALAAAGVEDPLLDAEVLLRHATGWDAARLAAEPGAELPPAAARRFAETVRRRLCREPVAYILGSKWFREIELAVDPRVLIPRPETELLVEVALELRPQRVLDVGTGSGAVALAVATELPDCRVTATDTSPAALDVAAENARRLGLKERVRFRPGSFLEDAEFDLVLANLPYVAEREWGSLQPEVTVWEPREALLGGPDGLDPIRSLLEALGRLRGSSGMPGEGSTWGPGAVALEVGEGQSEEVRGLMREAGFTAVETRRDLAGIERVVLGRR